jgi:hypothetical protein
MDLCGQLVLTYNANYLETASDRDKKILRKIVREYRDTDLGNQTLMNLLYNRDRQMKPLAPFISGPFSLSLHANKHMGMTVYTFGENHGTENMCQSQEMTITDYLSNLILTTDAFIDLFIEMHPITNKAYVEQWKTTEPRIDKSNESLYDLHKKFAPCMLDHERDECSLSRVHWIDSREMVFRNSILTHFRVWICRKGELNRKDIKDITPMIELFAKGNRDEIKFFFQEQLNITILASESDSYMKKDIYDFSIRSMNDYVSINKQNIVYYSRQLIADIKSKESLQGLCKALMAPTSVVADFYTLSRMFKDFQNVGVQPVRPMNIIFYGGNHHSNKIRQFLDEQAFDLVKYNTSLADQPSRCLDMTGFPQPFFNSMP